MAPATRSFNDAPSDPNARRRPSRSSSQRQAGESRASGRRQTIPLPRVIRSSPKNPMAGTRDMSVSCRSFCRLAGRSRAPVDIFSRLSGAPPGGRPRLKAPGRDLRPPGAAARTDFAILVRRKDPARARHTAEWLSSPSSARWPLRGLRRSARAGLGRFSPHPPLVALALVTLALAASALFTRGNLSPGEREDRGNRWVLGAFALIGLMLGYAPALSDRLDLFVVGGEATRWAGVLLLRGRRRAAHRAGVRARQSLQRSGRNPARPRAGHRRALPPRSQPQLPRPADQHARLVARLPLDGSASC